MGVQDPRRDGDSAASEQRCRCLAGHGAVLQPAEAGAVMAPEESVLSVGGMAMNRPGGTEGYTTVHTVFRVVSNRTALASVGFKFVSYMGFSKDACPLLFSWPA